jgi:hypothetical protein
MTMGRQKSDDEGRRSKNKEWAKRVLGVKSGVEI